LDGSNESDNNCTLLVIIIILVAFKKIGGINYVRRIGLKKRKSDKATIDTYKRTRKKDQEME